MFRYAIEIARKHDQPGNACLAESRERRARFRPHLDRDANQADQAPLVRHVHHGFGVPDLGIEQALVLRRDLHVEIL